MSVIREAASRSGEAEFWYHVPDGFELVRVLQRSPGACNEYLLRRA